MASSRFGCNDGFTLAGRMADRRGDRRLRTPRVVQVIHAGETAYARCHDFSDTGMKLDLVDPLALDAFVTVALSPSLALCGTVAWVRGRECGVVFDDPVDSGALLDAAEPPQGAVRSPATLALLGGRAWPGHPFPPPHGRPGRHFEAGLAVTVVGPDREQRGVVRWAHGNVAELELEEGPAPRALLPGPQSR